MIIFGWPSPRWKIGAPEGGGWGGVGCVEARANERTIPTLSESDRVEWFFHFRRTSSDGRIRTSEFGRTNSDERIRTNEFGRTSSAERIRTDEFGRTSSDGERHPVWSEGPGTMLPRSGRGREEGLRPLPRLLSNIIKSQTGCGPPMSSPMQRNLGPEAFAAPLKHLKKI